MVCEKVKYCVWSRKYKKWFVICDPELLNLIPAMGSMCQAPKCQYYFTGLYFYYEHEIKFQMKFQMFYSVSGFVH